MSPLVETREVPDLRARREALGVSAERLGRIANCSLGTVYEIEKRRRTPSAALAARIDAALRQLEGEK